MAGVVKVPSSARAARSPHKQPHLKRARGSQRSPHHGKKPRMRVTLDNGTPPPPRRTESPLSPLSPPMDSRPYPPESSPTSRAIEWPLRFLRFSRRLYPHPPSPTTTHSQSAATESHTSPRRKNTTSGVKCVAIVAAALILVTVSTTFYVMWRRSKRSEALVATVCKTTSCLKYSKLLLDAMDEDQSPCENFYKYVCGSWLNTHDSGDTVLGLAQHSFAINVASEFGYHYVPRKEQASIQKAVIYLQACLGVLNSSNVPAVRQALDRAGITWPRRNPKPDFLNVMFYMALQVNMPVFVHFSTMLGNSTVIILYLGQWPMFGEKMSTLASLCRTKQLANHMEIIFKSFGGTNNSRLNELTKQFEDMKEFFAKYSSASRKMKLYSNAMAFLQFTPTVSLEKWDALYKHYRNVTVSGAQGVEVMGVEYFAAVFQLHKKYGDAVMNDIVEGLAVENLIVFTDMRILESFYGNTDEARKAVEKMCFAVSYRVFGYAINDYFLRSKSVPYNQAKQLAEDIREKLPKLLSRNSSLVEGSTNRSNFEAVFDVLEKSRPEMYHSAYESYPDMTADPLRNWLFVVEFGKNETAKERSFIRRSMNDNIKFQDFRLMMHDLFPPVFSSDAHWAIRYGGIGARIAATLFCDYIEGSGRAVEVYRTNQDCLSGKTAGSIDMNLQAAVASAGVILRLFELARSTNAGGDILVADMPHFRSEQLPFIFGCHLLCGEYGGEELCNTPVKHSDDFARVFTCPQDSPMNPRKKCWMLPP